MNSKTNKKTDNRKVILFALLAAFGIFLLFTVYKPFSQNAAKKALNIVSVSPMENESNIGLYHPLSITFAEPLTTEQEESLEVHVAPNIETEQTMSGDNRTAILTPVKTMHSDQTYTLTVTMQGKSYTWSFHTPKAKDVSLEDQKRLQSQGDAEYSRREALVRTTYPWYDTLPIREKNYFVYFELETKRLIAKLYPQRNQTTSLDDQVTNMRAEIETKINDRGIDTKQHPINWQIFPEN